ncbi:hypothetical protein GCM10010344_76170 [Streptomyces bluensis]|nr:hypothetical protein GCM10010344_76170 [Streptomyces bluensis]
MRGDAVVDGAGADAFGGQFGEEFGRCVGVTGDDTVVGAVDGGEVEPAVPGCESFPQPFDGHQGGHHVAAPVQAELGGAPARGDAGGVVEGEGARDAGGGDLAEAVADDRRGPYPDALPEGGQRHHDGEEGGLGDVGCGQCVGAAQDVEGVVVQVRGEGVGALFHAAGEHRGAVEEFAGHAGPLGAVAGEDEDGSAVAGGGPALGDVVGGGAVGQGVQGRGEVVGAGRGDGRATGVGRVDAVQQGRRDAVRRSVAGEGPQDAGLFPYGSGALSGEEPGAWGARERAGGRGGATLFGHVLSRGWTRRHVFGYWTGRVRGASACGGRERGDGLIRSPHWFDYWDGRLGETQGDGARAGIMTTPTGHGGRVGVGAGVRGGAVSSWPGVPGG